VDFTEAIVYQVGDEQHPPLAEDHGNDEGTDGEGEREEEGGQHAAHAKRQGNGEVRLPGRCPQRLGGVDQPRVDVLDRPEQRQGRHWNDVVQEAGADEDRNVVSAGGGGGGRG